MRNKIYSLNSLYKNNHKDCIKTPNTAKSTKTLLTQSSRKKLN